MTNETAASGVDRRNSHFADLIGRAGSLLLQGDNFFRELVNVLPAAVYAIDASGSVVYYNEAAADIWGYRPELGKTKWCGSRRIFWPDGRELPHDQCLMAVAVRDRQVIRGVEAVVERPDGSRVSLIPHPTPFFDESGIFLGAVNLMVDITERKRSELTQRLAQEAEHRTRNILATVAATVQLSNSETTDGLKAAIHGRIQALANATELLVQSRWAGAEMHELVAQELSPYCQEGEARAQFGGPPVMLPAHLAQCIAVALHELATNAVKYGALSEPQGRVRVDWFHSSSSLVIRWVEVGGPHTEPPTRTGWGTRVMQGLVEQQMGKIQFNWQMPGLVCEIVFRI